jgi:predicted nucleic acid-binding protein
MLYLDTSVLVAALTNEVASTRVQNWIGEQQPSSLAISGWVVAEFSSALALKLRTSRIGPTDRAAALAVFNRLAVETLETLSISESRFRAAAQLTDQSLGLRAGDALHLAIAAEHGATLCTLDRRLAEAGPAVDLRAGDALHLAIAAEHGATLCTLDRRLAEAGPAVGVPTRLL